MAVQVTITDLTNKVHQGWKKDALALHYGLPKTQVARLLKQAGLTIRKFHAPKFVLVDDTVSTTVDAEMTEEVYNINVVDSVFQEDNSPEELYEVRQEVVEQPTIATVTAGADAAW